ncbi:MAG: metal ABC transporter permease [Phycisphaeraceae bacterium]|nr:metal ABC transporter permease [Phycisphaerae bacterium]MBX3392582.1 metal ABC transporter permease [Phycisphaeraceae bacterium]
MIAETWDIILLRDSTTRTVVAGTALLGLASGVIGTFAVLRRRSLVGDAVAHASLPGVCVAFFVVGDRHFPSLLIGALVFGLLGAGCIAAIREWTRIKEDAAIGLVLGTFFGLGIVLSGVIQRMPGGNRAGLDGFLFGKAASMVSSDAWTIGGTAAGTVALVALLFKEFRLLCFDREYAASSGIPVLWMDLLLLALVTTCTVAGLPAAGVVMVAALLIIPASAARFWTENLTVMTVIAGFFGVASAVVGTMVSATVIGPAGAFSRGLPTGPCITLAATAFFLLSMVFAPRRGVVADVWRLFSLRRELALQRPLRRVLRVDSPPETEA